MAKQEIYSAFILRDDQTWVQPSFSVPVGTAPASIEKALLAQYGGFFVAGLQEDDDANKACIEHLKV